MPSCRATFAAVALAAATAGAAPPTAKAGYLRVVTSELGPMPAGRTRDDWPSEPIDLPQVAGGSPAAAARINAQLALGTMGTPPPVEPGAPLATFKDWSGISGLEYEVERNDERLLSIRLTVASCGAHCEWFQHVVHFDPRTGRQVHLADLLAPAGLVRVRTAAATAGVANYGNGLARLPHETEPADADSDADASAAAPNPPDDGLVQPAPPADNEPIDLADDPGGQAHRAVFEECQQQWQQALDAADTSKDEPDFELAEDGVMTLALPDCRHDPRGMGLETPVSPAPAVVLRPVPLARLATPYGRALILRGADVPPFDAWRGQVVFGRVGTARVTMKLPDEPGSARYFYERYRKLIDLAGTCAASGCSLSEPGGVFELHPDRGGLAGTWHGNGKTLPVRLE